MKTGKTVIVFVAVAFALFTAVTGAFAQDSADSLSLKEAANGIQNRRWYERESHLFSESHVTEEVLQQQADQYAKLFEVYAKNADVIERVSFWNLHDSQSWLNYFPWKRENHPLLFDREINRKPAHAAVVKVLNRYRNQK